MREEKKYNYLEEYREDSFAKKHNLDPIVFNDGNIAQVEFISEVEGWDQSKIDRLAGSDGHIKFRKCLVKCPKHNEFFQLLEDDPRPWTYNCRLCITEEIGRVVSARYIRDTAYWKSVRGGNK